MKVKELIALLQTVEQDESEVLAFSMKVEMEAPVTAILAGAEYNGGPALVLLTEQEEEKEAA